MEMEIMVWLFEGLLCLVGLGGGLEEMNGWKGKVFYL